MIWIIFIGIAVISYIVQANLKNKFNRYSREPLASSMTGRDVALKMLHDNGIYDVQVTSTPGQLTDHYNPANKTVNLSEGVYNSCSVAAAAVAAHECGHAVQHATAYSMLKMRSNLVPIVNFSSQIMSWVLLAGILMVQTMPQILLIGIVLFATTTLFSFITLPVEIDASRRAVAYIERSGMSSKQVNGAKKVLTAAALTYVAAALTSIIQLLYLMARYNRNSNR